MGVASFLRVVAAVAVAGGLVLGCTSTADPPPTGDPSSTGTRSASASAGGTRLAVEPVPTVSVPDGFVLSDATRQSAKEHSGLLTAVPGAFSALTTWTLRSGAISATVSRLAVTLNYAPANPETLLKALVATPHGSDSFGAWDTNGVHVVRAHRAWIDSFAWVDPNENAAWVLTEGFDQHSNQWPGLIADFIAAQR